VFISIWLIINILGLNVCFEWNRMENEHLNNVGKYRAFKSVPLPFNYHDDDEESSDT
jgi:hypothetical protein